ncbi:hypothetical protein [Botrimarina sp.]|uniref:hypothetical protein n=1 Tax=Botrimarina sp. TaxID=2795802 RepID=UPI0032EC4CF8
MSYPPATPHSMGVLAELLAKWGVGLRVVDGELRIRDPAGRLIDADRAAVRHYAADLARMLEGRDDEPPYLDPTRCPRCDADLEADAVAYRTDAAGGLLERCMACGATWPWGRPEGTTPAREPTNQRKNTDT